VAVVSGKSCLIFLYSNLGIGPWDVVWRRVVVIAGLSMVFSPLNVAAFLHILTELRGAAVGLLALLRNENGSVGTSMAQTLLERCELFHLLRLNERLDTLNPAVHRFLEQGQTFFRQRTGDAPLSRQITVQALEHVWPQQALALVYFDVFVASAAVAVLLVCLVLLIRRSVAEKGTHIRAE
jgi:DHA2 family multidrug resistance protein